MAKVLDLDQIVPASRVIRIRGHEYELQPLSVKDFIEFTRQTEELQKRLKSGVEIPMSELLEMQHRSVSLALPSMPKDELDKLTYAQLEAITAFAKETATAEAPKGGAEGKEVQAS